MREPVVTVFFIGSGEGGRLGISGVTFYEEIFEKWIPSQPTNTLWINMAISGYTKKNWHP